MTLDRRALQELAAGLVVVNESGFPLPPSEDVCLDCMEGDHQSCRDNAGYMHDDTPERCGCHLTSHALDNREARW